MWCVLCAVQFVTICVFVGNKNISVVKMHGATIKKNCLVKSSFFFNLARYYGVLVGVTVWQEAVVVTEEHSACRLHRGPKKKKR